MGLPLSEQNLAYSALVLAVKNDPVLKREIKTLITWTGEAIVPPASGDVPYLCLKPRSAPNQDWQTNRHVGGDLQVDVEIVLAGTDSRTAMDAWQALERALLPKDESEYDARWDRYIAAGIGEIAFRQGSVEVKEDGGGLTLVGKGQILIRRQWQAKTQG